MSHLGLRKIHERLVSANAAGQAIAINSARYRGMMAEFLCIDCEIWMWRAYNANKALRHVTQAEKQFTYCMGHSPVMYFPFLVAQNWQPRSWDSTSFDFFFGSF